MKRINTIIFGFLMLNGIYFCSLEGMQNQPEPSTGLFSAFRGFMSDRIGGFVKFMRIIPESTSQCREKKPSEKKTKDKNKNQDTDIVSKAMRTAAPVMFTPRSSEFINVIAQTKRINHNSGDEIKISAVITKFALDAVGAGNSNK